MKKNGKRNIFYNLVIKMYFIFKILYTYIDIITDMYLVYEIYELKKEDSIISRYLAVGLLLIFQVYERGFTYSLLKQMNEKQKKENQSHKYHNNMKLFFITLFYGEYIFMWRY